MEKISTDLHTVKKPVLFYDTNALLNLQERAFNGSFIISQVTLEEIENIKTSSSKDNEVKYKARKLAHLLDEQFGNYVVVPKTIDIESIVIEHGQISITPDTLITASAFYINQQFPVLFVTDDICCKFLSKNIYGLLTKGINEIDLFTDAEEYKGYKDVTLSDDEMSYFYCNLSQNIFDCKLNEYLIIRKSDGEIVDSFKWSGEKFSKVCNKTIKSVMFGDKIRPKDVYQSFTIDSILSNTITAVTGKPGSGKSLISLISIMHLIEKGDYDRVVILFNPTKTKGAADMGFYSGDALEKAMQSNIGNILTTKFGDKYAVDMLIAQEKLKLVSMADIRGMEIRDNEILYISECQNTSIELLKLSLSRASSGCKIIIEGDYERQVDSFSFAGSNNGLKRAINVLAGNELFGYVNLQNVWRSKIAELVDKM